MNTVSVWRARSSRLIVHFVALLLGYVYKSCMKRVKTGSRSTRTATRTVDDLPAVGVPQAL